MTETVLQLDGFGITLRCMGLAKRKLTKSDIVSQRLNHLLFINGYMTQKRLAFQMGIPVSTIGSKMVGRARWNLDEVDALGRIFGVTRTTSSDTSRSRQPSP